MQNKLNIQIKVTHPRIGNDIPLPGYGTSGAAGMDVMAAIDEAITLAPGQTVLIDTGVAIFVEDPNYAAILLPRSGLGHKRGLVLGNLVGLIDSDYQGPLKVSLWNRGTEPQVIEPFDRIAQLVLIPVISANWQIVKEFKQTERGAGGFGSTGVSATRGEQPHYAHIDELPYFNANEQPEAMAESEKWLLPWSVWTEGYAATGQSSPAEFRGEFMAATFEEACLKWVATLDAEGQRCYNKDKNTFWGCRLFDNEVDARKSFG